MGLSQETIASKLFVTKSAVAHWEKGIRMPDATMLIKIADRLDIDVALLINAASQGNTAPNVIMVDDEKIILNGGIPITPLTPGALAPASTSKSLVIVPTIVASSSG